MGSGPLSPTDEVLPAGTLSFTFVSVVAKSMPRLQFVLSECLIKELLPHDH